MQSHGRHYGVSMIPVRIARHLASAGIRYEHHVHDRAVTAQELAESLGVGGYQVAKTVLLHGDARMWMAVVPGPEVVDLHRAAQALHVATIRLVEEADMVLLFPDCEVGAEPPLGSLYRVPVVLDKDLAEEPRMTFRAGSHDEAVSMASADFIRLERPLIADIAVPIWTSTEVHV